MVLFLQEGIGYDSEMVLRFIAGLCAFVSSGISQGFQQSASFSRLPSIAFILRIQVDAWVIHLYLCGGGNNTSSVVGSYTSWLLVGCTFNPDMSVSKDDPI